MSNYENYAININRCVRTGRKPMSALQAGNIPDIVSDRSDNLLHKLSSSYQIKQQMLAIGQNLFRK